MKINLKSLIGSDIQVSDETRNLNIKGVTKAHKVMIIPLELCHYNEQNGRISTYISQYESDGNTLNKDDLEKYNAVLEDFIYKSNPKALNTTKKNINAVGQLVAGVVLNDGRIIDGNRRFTALRKLKTEGKSNVFFHAVILDESEGINKKDIKTLELQLQHAEEKPLDYNPIDNLVDVYRDIIENKLFELKEYSDTVNKPLKDVKLLVKKAMLMEQFLQFINAPKQYYIARDFALDGPLQEVVSIIDRALRGIDILSVMNKDYKDKNEQAEYIRIRNFLFTTIFSARSNKNEDSGDLSRYVRETGKYIVNTSIKDEVLEKFEDIVDEIMEEFVTEEVRFETLDKIGENLSDVTKDALTLIDTEIESAKREQAQLKPVALINSAHKTINSIEIDQVRHMDDDSQGEFILVYEDIKNKLDELGKVLNV